MCVRSKKTYGVEMQIGIYNMLRRLGLSGKRTQGSYQTQV
jgi:hypothetical protein